MYGVYHLRLASRPFGARLRGPPEAADDLPRLETCSSTIDAVETWRIVPSSSVRSGLVIPRSYAGRRPGASRTAQDQLRLRDKPARLLRHPSPVRPAREPSRWALGRMAGIPPRQRKPDRLPIAARAREWRWGMLTPKPLV